MRDLSSVPIVASFEERTIGAERKSLLRPEVVEKRVHTKCHYGWGIECIQSVITPQ